MSITSQELKKISAKTLAEEVGITLRHIRRHILTLKETGVIERIGITSNGHWVVK